MTHGILHALVLVTFAVAGGCGKPAYKRAASESIGDQDANKSHSRSRLSDLNDDDDSGVSRNDRSQTEAEKKIESEIDKEIENSRHEEQKPATDTGTGQQKRCQRQYQTALTSDIVIDGKYGPIPYHVTASGGLDIKVGQTKGLFKVDFQLLSAKPYLAQDEAKRRMEGQSGTRILTVLSDDEFDELKKKDPAWSKIACTIVPIKSQVFTVEGKQVAAEYEPALPFAILPKGDTADFDQEIGESLTFSNVKVKIVDISPDLHTYQPGDVISGSVHVSKIAANEQRIRSDVAYHLSFDFGADTPHNYALGFTGDWTNYLIDTKKQEFNGVVVPVIIAEDNKTEIIFQK